jgi:cytochrome c oxidase subunit I+III
VVALPWPACAALALLAVAAALLARGALLALRRSVAAAAIAQLGSVLAQALAAGVALWLAVTQVPAPTTHAYLAVTVAFLAYAALHAGIGAVLAGLAAWRCATGYVSARRSADLRTGALWHDFSAATTLLALGFLLALPWLAPVRGLAAP